MRRTLFLLILLPLALLFISSCDLVEELSYLEYQGVRYNVSEAIYEFYAFSGDGDDYDEWYIEIGTGDRIYDPSGYSWSGSDPVFIVTLRAQTDVIEGSYVTLDSNDTGVMWDLELRIEEDGVPLTLNGFWDEENDLITVSKTGNLFVVDVNVMMDDGDGELLTGHFVGTLTEIYVD